MAGDGAAKKHTRNQSRLPPSLMLFQRLSLWLPLLPQQMQVLPYTGWCRVHVWCMRACPGEGKQPPSTQKRRRPQENKKTGNFFSQLLNNGGCGHRGLSLTWRGGVTLLLSSLQLYIWQWYLDTHLNFLPSSSPWCSSPLAALSVPSEWRNTHCGASIKWHSPVTGKKRQKCIQEWILSATLDEIFFLLTTEERCSEDLVWCFFTHFGTGNLSSFQLITNLLELEQKSTSTILGKANAWAVCNKWFLLMAWSLFLLMNRNLLWSMGVREKDKLHIRYCTSLMDGWVKLLPMALPCDVGGVLWVGGLYTHEMTGAFLKDLGEMCYRIWTIFYWT